MSAVLREVALPQPIWTPDWSAWPVDQALRLRVVVAHDADQQAWALTPAVDDLRLREAVQRRVGRALRWQAVSESELNTWLAQGEQSFDARGSLVQLAQVEEGDEAAVQALSVDAISRQSSPVVKLLDATLFDALKAQASDLHLESTPQGMVVRHRLDGVMVQVD
ncbi:MAG TPA: hypothetical protein VFM33_00410, partial [Aquabacterium sp.]|nr:hypothetical protein [Aquabacterium sp.]